MTTSTNFVCKCGVSRSWISHGVFTSPCPSCGRVYRGVERFNKRSGLTEILALEVTNKQTTNVVWKWITSKMLGRFLWLCLFTVLFTTLEFFGIESKPLYVFLGGVMAIIYVKAFHYD